MPEIDFPLMATLNFRTGAAPYALDSLNNKMVRLLAFVLPLDDMTQETASFLLVPYVGACVHTPPPPPNQLVQVVMLNSVKVPVAWWTPVFIEGILHIEQIDSPYGKASFRMDGVRAIDYVTKRLINVGVSH
ncbi:MAG: DUF3299 domain-containing protein [Phycisphaerae bacterium]|nr:DUF3299 domain-containing protein [Gemmatimonadaceae bacterium]